LSTVLLYIQIAGRIAHTVQRVWYEASSAAIKGFAPHRTEGARPEPAKYAGMNRRRAQRKQTCYHGIGCFIYFSNNPFYNSLNKYILLFSFFLFILLCEFSIKILSPIIQLYYSPLYMMRQEKQLLRQYLIP
jgi:hypothetical protein